MNELSAARPDNRQDTAPDTADRGDHRTVPVDEAGKENWAENTSPLTRSQYADLMRGELAARQQNAGADAANGTGDGQQQNAAGQDEHRELPAQPQTRQETTGEAPSSVDRRPLPAAGEATGRRAGGDAGAAREETLADWPTPEERAQLHETYLDWRKDVEAGRERGTNLIGDKPDRSPDDRSDLPPAGEELLSMEGSEKRSRLDGLRQEWERDEVLDGLHEEIEQDATTVQNILQARPPEGHPVQVVPDVPQISPVNPAGLDAGTMAGAGLMVGVMLVELGRQLHKIRKQGKEAG
jgi:hypothetical protein